MDRIDIAALAALAALPVMAGSVVDLSGKGWTCEQNGVTKEVSVPADVEEYFADMSAYAAPRIDASQHGSWIVRQWLKCKGESTWRRKFTLKSKPAGKRIVLMFESTRYFADIFVNGKFVHHDEAPDTPYEVDITDAAKSGENELLVKIVNPEGGDYDWRDFNTCKWEGKQIPGGRAMGGLSGRVKLDVRDIVSIDDVFVQNTPAISEVEVFVSITNAGTKAEKRLVRLEVEPKGVVFSKEMTLQPGLTVVSEKASAPEAKLWDLDNPNLYNAVATAGGETFRREFGYRWIAPEGIGTNAVLRLNGKRIVVRTAIGWGWYMGSGTVPSDEDARREVATAKALGQNGISFHRHNGQENILREADRNGLLIYAEPGAFQGGRHSDIGRRIALERVRRWVKAFRSHPSLFHYNLINEFSDTCDDATRKFFLDGVRLVHELDPSRTVTLMSAWGKDGINVRHFPKTHMRPFDPELYESGWRDSHRAGGPVIGWSAGAYRNKDAYNNRSSNLEEIVYWGEENAFTAPPRLQLIVDELDRRGRDGTDGRVFRVWADMVNKYLDRKGLRGTYPTLDAFCLDLGRQSLLHQGRNIELVRMDDVADGYAINGWESMVVENNSGIVDTMRNPKGEPKWLAKYNAPLKLCVNSNQSRVRKGQNISVDVHIINEVDLKGPQKLVVELWNLEGGERKLAEERRDVSVTGGERFGEFLSEKISFNVPFAGEGEVRAHLEGVKDATGDFPFTSFDLAIPEFPAGYKIAVAEAGDTILKWLRGQKLPCETYKPGVKADVVIVSRPPGALPAVPDAKSLVGQRGTPGVVDVRWYVGEKLAAEDTRNSLEVEFPQGVPPAKGVDLTTGYSVCVAGCYVARWDGRYRFRIEGPDRNADKLKFFWNGDDVKFDSDGYMSAELKAGDSIPFYITMTQQRAKKLSVIAETPEPVEGFDPDELVACAKNDGARVVFVDNVKVWMPVVADLVGVKYDGWFHIGQSWLGGAFFTKKGDPLLAGFPAGAVNEAYEEIAGHGSRYGLFLEGEDLAMGAWQCENCKLGTVVGRIPCGKGEVVVSTLNLVKSLNTYGGTRYFYNLLTRSGAVSRK